MKVILLKDVAKIGRRFEVVVVPDGYALNKLIPNKMAIPATPENLKRQMNVSSKQEENKVHDATAFKETLTLLKDIEVTIQVDANAEGGMFQSLKKTAIVEAVQSATQATLDPEHIMLQTPIKSLGEHIVPLKSGNIEGSVTLHVIAKTK